MKLSKTIERSLQRHFGDKCRSCKNLRSAPNKGKNVKFWCALNKTEGTQAALAQFPFAKNCPTWEAEWTEGTQSVTIGDYLAAQAGLIKEKK